MTAKPPVVRDPVTRLVFNEGASKKFWEASLEQNQVLVRWGRLGTSGQSKPRSFKTAREAREEHDALVLQKLKKGYTRANAPDEPPREPHLEAAMFDALEREEPDPGPSLVYSDWLQAHGNAWGELIAVQHALERTPGDKGLKKREKQLLKSLPLPEKDLGAVTWKRGCIDSIHIFNERDWSNASYDVVPLVRALFELPHCGGLRELRTGVIRWDANPTDVETVLAEAAKRPFAARLRRLFLGDVSDFVDMDHHVIGDVRSLSKQFPALVELKLHSGSSHWSRQKAFEFGPLELPRLRTLVIETCGLTHARARQLTASKLPSLESLEVWVGSPDYAASANEKDFAPLLKGTVFPRVTKLALKNNEFTDVLAAQLVQSEVAPRLESLDLSMGILGAEGVRALAAAAKKFARLKTLNVSDSYLSNADVKALNDAFVGVTVIAKGQKELDPLDEGHRYVSVHE